MADMEMKIKVDLEKAIDALLWMEDEQYEGTCNGYHGIHIMPGQFEQMETNIIECGIRFFQSGNFYPPGTPPICKFGIHALFNIECIYRDTDFDFMDSRHNAEEYGLQSEEEIQSAIDEHVKATREVCAFCKKDEIICDCRYFDAEANEEKLYEHRYHIEWR